MPYLNSEQTDPRTSDIKDNYLVSFWLLCICLLSSVERILFNFDKFSFLLPLWCVSFNFVFGTLKTWKCPQHSLSSNILEEPVRKRGSWNSLVSFPSLSKLRINMALLHPHYFPPYIIQLSHPSEGISVNNSVSCLNSHLFQSALLCLLHD